MKKQNNIKKYLKTLGLALVVAVIVAFATVINCFALERIENGWYFFQGKTIQEYNTLVGSLDDPDWLYPDYYDGAWRSRAETSVSGLFYTPFSIETYSFISLFSLEDFNSSLVLDRLFNSNTWYISSFDTITAYFVYNSDDLTDLISYYLTISTTFYDVDGFFSVEMLILQYNVGQSNPSNRLLTYFVANPELGQPSILISNVELNEPSQFLLNFAGYGAYLPQPSTNLTWFDLIASIVDIPVNYLQKILGATIFGASLFNIFATIAVIGIAIFIARKFATSSAGGSNG